jgi:hypothetical protein
MTDDAPQSKALTVVMDALNWAYDHAISDIPGLGSAEELGESYLKSTGNREAAIGKLIAWQMSYAGAAGFASNIGGFATMPIGIPANLVSVFAIQLRMIAAIAHLRGYKVNDPHVRTLAYLCLTGSSAGEVVKEFGVNFGTKLTAAMIMKIPGKVLININKAVGFRLMTKAGSTGLLNLTKIVPLIGGVIGGGFDMLMTKGIGTIAKDTFTLIDDAGAPAPDQGADLIIEHDGGGI